MTITEARRIERAYYDNPNPSEDDNFVFTEAMDYIIQTEKDPQAMISLGGYYYDDLKFDIALKYYEMAAEYGLASAYMCLGYIWYYGRTGTKDYEKAFNYYTLAKNAGSTIAVYKLADMYKNGYYVEKDYDTYCKIIEELEEEINSITTTEPYIYHELLDNPELVRQKMKEFEEEHESYVNYKAELEVKLKEVQEQ